MQIDAESLSLVWLWTCRLLALLVAAGAAFSVDWRGMLRDPSAVHRFAACAVSMMVLWSIQATVAQGPGLHILGVTTVTLVLGPATALIATLVAEIVTSLTSGADHAIAASWLAGSVLPVLVTDGCRRVVRRWLPRDPFSFIFGCGFFAAALAASAAHLGAFLMVGGPDQIWSGAVPSAVGFLLLIAFPEAFINGCVVTLLIVYCPQRMVGYDADYERRRRL
jgi:uncharacterized membrane protein